MFWFVLSPGYPVPFKRQTLLTPPLPPGQVDLLLPLVCMLIRCPSSEEGSSVSHFLSLLFSSSPSSSVFLSLTLPFVLAFHYPLKSVAKLSQHGLSICLSSNKGSRALPWTRVTHFNLSWGWPSLTVSCHGLLPTTALLGISTIF